MSLSLCAWLPDYHVFFIKKREAKAPPMWRTRNSIHEKKAEAPIPQLINWLRLWNTKNLLLADSFSVLYERKAKSGSQ